MSISYPLSFPAVGISGVTIRAKNVVAISASPFTGQQQVYKHPGQWWEMEVTMPAMTRADAEAVAAFLFKLNGQYGTFTLGDPANTSPRGVGTGTPLVKNGGQTGSTLVTDGWTAGTANILRAGDWIQLGTGASTKLHKVLDDVSSDGTGTASLTIWPDLRSSPSDNAAITVNNTQGLWRLASNSQDYSIDIGKIYGITFACMEAL